MVVRVSVDGLLSVASCYFDVADECVAVIEESFSAELRPDKKSTDVVQMTILTDLEQLATQLPRYTLSCLHRTSATFFLTFFFSPGVSWYFATF